jgi:alpha-galactosidase
MTKRIVIIGAGSALFTKGILGSLLADDRFSDSTVVLMDADPDILSLMERYGARLTSDNPGTFKIEATISLEQALEGADFVITTLAADDSVCRGLEVEVPLRFGYYHSWGDTTGPSGVFRGLRHIPIFLDIAAEMERRCPNAWLLNITDPMAVLCRAVTLKSGIRMVGFCDGPPYFWMLIEQEILGLPPGSLDIRMAGIDHLVWVLKMSKDGEDVYPLFRDRIEKWREKFPVNAAIFETYSYLPTPGDEHIAEFFPFYLRDEATMAHYGLKQMDMVWHRSRRTERLGSVQAAVGGSEPISPEQLPPEDSVILDILHSMGTDEQREFVFSLLNDGLVSNLPDYALVEVPVRLGKDIHKPPPVEIPTNLTPVLHSSIVKDELAVQAALTGDRELLFQPVLACPLIKSSDQARDITRAMLEALRDYLPEAFR